MLAPRSVKRKIANSSAADRFPALPNSQKTEDDVLAKDLVELPASNDQGEDLNGSHLSANMSATCSSSTLGRGSENNMGFLKEIEKPDPSTSANTVSDPDKEMLTLLRWTIEECFSDWALSCQYPELFRKIGLSSTNCEHTRSCTAVIPLNSVDMLYASY